jgi:hypothetical protein
MISQVNHELISEGLKAAAQQYSQRGREYLMLTKKIFEDKYADKKLNKNLTMSFSKSEKAGKEDPSITRAAEGSAGTSGASTMVVGGLMRSVESVETTRLKEAIRKENFTEKWQEQASTVEDLYRRDIKFQLNILAPERFEELFPAFREIAFRNELSCKILVEEVILKAWSEQKYCQLYAYLCKCLCELRVELAPGAFPPEYKTESKNPFYFILVRRVETFFSMPEIDVPAGEDYEASFRKEKQKKMGNIKFIS